MNNEGQPQLVWQRTGEHYTAECWRNGRIDEVRATLTMPIQSVIAMGNKLHRVVPLGDYVPGLLGEGKLAHVSGDSISGQAKVVLLSIGAVAPPAETVLSA